MGRRPLLTLLACMALLVVAGCPRPLDDGRGGPARVAPDAVTVLRLPRIDRAERAARAYLDATRGGERSGLEAMLAFVVGGQTSGAALLGLDESAALLVSWRPSGEALVWLPVDDAQRFDVALDRLLEARGASRSDDVLGGVRSYRGDDGSVAMLARAGPGGALLWPAPADPFAAAALLDALAAGRVAERWPTGSEPPPSDAAAELFADRVGLAQVAPSLAGLFRGPASLGGARGRLSVTGDAMHLELDVSLDDAARAALAEQVSGAEKAPPGFCALVPDALALARVPVALLRSGDEDDGPLDELTGQLAIALLPNDDGAQPGWIALGRPAGLAARDELLAGVTAAGVVERRQERAGGRTVRVLTAPDGDERSALRVIADEDLFALAFEAEDAIARLASASGTCDEARDDAAVYLSVRPRALEGALASRAAAAETPPAGLGAEGGIASLKRLVARLPSGFARLEASASLDEGGVTLRAEGTLAPSSSPP